MARLMQRVALAAAAGAPWQRQLGPLLDIRQAQRLLGVRSRQAVHDLIQRHRLLGLTTEARRTFVPPAWCTARVLPADRAAAADLVGSASVGQCQAHQDRAYVCGFEAPETRGTLKCPNNC